MQHPLQHKFDADQALATQQDDMLARTRSLYRLGLTPRSITPSQMTAVGELIRTATSFVDATQRTTAWLDNQLGKLKAVEERGGKRTSWRLPPRGVGDVQSLGETLKHWIAEERYLAESVPATLDRLVALQHFWDTLYTMYRYEVAMKHEMALPYLDLQSITQKEAQA